MWLLHHKNELIDTGFFRGFTDYHSHILPGVDDGVKTLSEALEILDYFASLKVSRVVFTPHIMNGMKNEERITDAYNVLCEQYHGGIVLGLGAEYMLDSGFEEQLKRGVNQLDRDNVLVETSYFSPPHNLYELLYNASIAGYTPVIAHPERYLYMEHGDYDRVKEKDYLLQLNLLSLSGYYGRQVKKNAEFLLEQGWYDRVGTDLHDLQIFKKWVKKIQVTDRQLEQLMVAR